MVIQKTRPVRTLIYSRRATIRGAIMWALRRNLRAWRCWKRPLVARLNTIEILRYLCEITPAELRALSAREDLAAFVIAYAKRIIHAIDHNDTVVLEEIYNRAYGKPTSKLAFTDSSGDDKDGGIFIFLPDNQRGDGKDIPTEQSSVQPPMDKKEVKPKKTK